MADYPQADFYEPASMDGFLTEMERRLIAETAELRAENERLRALHAAALQFVEDRLHHATDHLSTVERLREMLGAGVVESGERR